MVSETAAVSDGRSFAAQIAARVLPQSFAMSHSRVSSAIWRTSSVTPVSACRAVCSTEHRWRSVSGVSRSHAPSAVTVSVSPRSPTVCARTDSDGRRQVPASMPVKVSGRTRCTLQRRCSSSRQSTCTEAEICNPFSTARTPQHIASAQII